MSGRQLRPRRGSGNGTGTTMATSQPSQPIEQQQQHDDSKHKSRRTRATTSTAGKSSKRTKSNEAAAPAETTGGSCRCVHLGCFEPQVVRGQLLDPRSWCCHGTKKEARKR